MPEITELLDATTPRDLPDVDVAGLARRAHTRHHRQRLATMVAALVVVAGAVATGVAVWPDRKADVTTDETDIDLDEPIGRWSTVGSPQFLQEAPAYLVELDDRRIAMWGAVLDNNPTGAPRWTVEGHLYDPRTGVWDIFQPAPTMFPSLEDFGVQLAQNRLAIIPFDSDHTINRITIYDFTDDRWIDAPPLPAEAANLQFRVAWDGEVLAMVLAEDADTPWQTLRWRLGGTTWDEGTAMGIDVGSVTGAAFDGTRLALWGNTQLPSSPSGGVLYDVAADTWQQLPDAPVSGGAETMMMWRDGQLFVGSSARTGVPADQIGDLAAYDPATNEWHEIPRAPEVDQIDPDSPPYNEGDEFVVSPAAGGSFEQASGWWFFDGDEWQPAPYHDLHQVAGLMVATNKHDDAAGRFKVEVRSPDGEWLDAATAPFEAAGVQTVTAAGNKLFVLHDGDLAVLDLAAE